MKRLTILSLLLTTNVFAGIEYGDLFIKSTIAFSDQITSHYGTVPYGDPTRLEVFSTIPTWGKFLLQPGNPHPNSFASALASGDGDMGVGVSGLRFSGDPTYAIPQAYVNYIFTVFNTGTTPVPLGFRYKIPQMELWISNFGEFAYAYTEARLETSQYLDDGTLLVSDKPFSYWANLSQRRYELYELKKSDDLAAFQPTSVYASEYIKYTYPIIEGWVPLGILEPGETMDFDYRLLTYIYSSPEAGAQAFVGDPFSVTGGQSSFEVFVAPNADTPEPATGALVLAALIACKAIIRRIK